MTSAERQQHRELHVVVRLADRVRAVVEHVHVDAGRQLGAELRQQRLDGVGDRDGVGAGLALDAERDGALLAVVRVEPRRGPLVLDAVDDRCRARSSRTGAPLRYATIIVLVLVGVHQLAGGLQRERLVRADDRCRSAG